MLEVGVFKVTFGMLSFFKANSLRINGRMFTATRGYTL